MKNRTITKIGYVLDEKDRHDMSKEYEYETRPIAGYEGLYSISNDGTVFSHDYNHTKQTKQLKPVKRSDGYLMVNLYQDSKLKIHFIHRLVLETFVPNPDNKPYCDHIDTDKTNNHVSNLRWCTHKENCNNPLTKASKKGKKHGRYDHTKYTFRNNNTAEVFVGSQYDFRNKYKLDQGNISRLINGKLKSVKGWVKIYEWGKTT